MLLLSDQIFELRVYLIKSGLGGGLFLADAVIEWSIGKNPNHLMRMTQIIYEGCTHLMTFASRIFVDKNCFCFGLQLVGLKDAWVGNGGYGVALTSVHSWWWG